MSLGGNLKYVRKCTGRSQLQVAKDIGISNAALSNYETGYREPDLEILKQLARYYEVSLDDLVGVTELLENRCYDLCHIIKSERIAFNGEEHELTDAQRDYLKSRIMTALEELGLI